MGVEIGWKLKGTDTSGIRFSYTAKGNSTVYTWTAEHVPRHKSYENAPDPSYYLPHILVYVKTYQQNRRDSIRQVFGAVGDLYRFYRKLIRNVDNTVAAELKPLVDSVTNGASSQEEKANRIYRYVQEHIKYVAFEDGLNGFIPRAAADVWKRRYGDCKDMTSLLVAMCRQAGIPAYFTWIGTRKNPYAYEDTPLPIVDNHMICTIQLQDRWFFLDGTDAQIPFGIPPAGIQGKEALVGIDEERYKILVVPVAAAENNLTLDSTFIRLSGRKVAGLARMKLQGYPAWSLRDVLNYKNEHEKEDLVMRVMSRGSNKFIQKRFDYTASDDLEKSFQATSEFELNDYSQHTGREWYLNMHLVRSFEDMLIDKAERLAPLEHRYLGKTRQVVVLEIPEGYQVEHLPPAAERSASGLWSFRVSYEVVDNKVLLTKEFEIKSLYIKPEQFELHNQLVKDLKDQYRQTVSLKAK